MAAAIENSESFIRLQIPSNIDLLACHAFNRQRYPFLLESNGVDQANNGFDILFAFPGEKIESFNLKNNDFFAKFDESFNSLKTLNSCADLPFTGGWFVFLSYELLAAIEPKLSGLKTDNKLPIASAVRIPIAIIKRHKDDTCWIVCEKGEEALIDDVMLDLNKLKKTPLKKPIVRLQEDHPEAFLNGVKKVKSYLIEGDTLQVNLSRQWTGDIKQGFDYLDVYRSLRQHNPAPFSGLACLNNSVVCSSSPERLINSLDETVQMRPIAGTRPRDDDEDTDKEIAKELLLNAKESAEHIMLIDLIRNDLGKICQTGTVKVDEKMTLESYASVHHIVSNVSGKLSANKTPTDIIKAVFPGGTITGCPKVRCMEIIDELEDAPRGAYTGSMGYINRNGDLDLNILIRTFTVNGAQIILRTGAGIVADSIAVNELIETRHKAKALLEALAPL